jgi:hypothetical protein
MFTDKLIEPVVRIHKGTSRKSDASGLVPVHMMVDGRLRWEGEVLRRKCSTPIGEVTLAAWILLTLGKGRTSDS